MNGHSLPGGSHELMNAYQDVSAAASSLHVSNEFILPPTHSSTAEVPHEHFELPISPTKRLGVRLAESQNCLPPESPDMKFARNRLGTLLTSIRTGDAPPLSTEKVHRPVDEDRRGPGRPKKTPNAGTSKNKNGEMVFELRGKPFALREDRNCTEYQLCRAWMRGKLNDDDRPPPPPPADPRVSTDLLATRSVTSLPRATSPYAVDSQFPDRKDLDVFNKELDPANLEVLRKEYARHWKSVKRTWKSHTRLRAQRYHRTTALLETIFTIAQQNHD